MIVVIMVEGKKLVRNAWMGRGSVSVLQRGDVRCEM